MVTPGTDPDGPPAKYEHDPRISPHLSWAGKRETPGFEVDTVSLHTHERVDPSTIIEKAFRSEPTSAQRTLFFDQPENNPPLRDAVDFYQHDQNWTNRLIAGDSLLVMNSLLEKEGMEGKVQTIYIDPPYGIKYHSNFQPFVSKKSARDGNDKDMTQEPEMIKAFRDTWKLGIHSYLSYLRDRLLLAKKLLADSGSIFVQISIENLHHVREVMDEVFGNANFCSMIVFATTTGKGSKLLDTVNDFILWYAKDKKQVKYRQLYAKKTLSDTQSYDFVEDEDGGRHDLSDAEKQDIATYKNLKVFCVGDTTSASSSPSTVFEFEFDGEKFNPKPPSGWKTNLQGMQNLERKNRLRKKGSKLGYVRFWSDFPFKRLDHMWSDTSLGFAKKLYVVRTSTKVIKRCILMTTDPGDLVLDPTCGSGTTAFVAEDWGRRWITCDTSRIAIAITRKRLMTAFYKYYKLAYPNTGVSAGFIYKQAKHVTLESVAQDKEPEIETLYDCPDLDNTRHRVSGPFTVEAVPSPTAVSIDALNQQVDGEQQGDGSANATRQQEWRDSLLRTGIRGKGGDRTHFLRVEPHPVTKQLHAKADTGSGDLAVVSFGPEHAPLEQRQVARALEEAESLVPKPKIVVFAAMQFDPEAAKDIDETRWPGVRIMRAEMNKDLLTADLKKGKISDDLFWQVGRPDVDLETRNGMNVVTVRGFDFFNADGKIVSGDASNIAMWMLDEDYDGRSIYPGQVFFPMQDGGWEKLAKTLRTKIDLDLIKKYAGTESIPFKTRDNKRAAVKIIDDRGIESVRILDLE